MNFPLAGRPRRILLAFVALYVVALLVINLSGVYEHRAPVDCLLVPGARVESTGKPGPLLMARLNRAIELYQSGRARGVVCTGGRGESGPIESQSARDYLTSRGIPGEAVLLEEMSHTTWENFVFAKLEMDRRGWRSCLVVTDPFHMRRCRWMAQEVGLQAYAAPTFSGPAWRPRGLLYYSTREGGAWLKYAAERARRVSGF